MEPKLQNRLHALIFALVVGGLFAWTAGVAVRPCQCKPHGRHRGDDRERLPIACPYCRNPFLARVEPREKWTPCPSCGRIVFLADPSVHLTPSGQLGQVGELAPLPPETPQP